MRRFALPLVLFVLAFAGSFGGAYAWRQNQNERDEQVATVTTLPSDTTVPDTTALLEVPPDTVAPDTTVAPDETVPVVTDAPLEEPVLNASGSFLVATGSTPEPYDDAGGCVTLSASVEDCDQVEADGTTLAWVKETADSGGGVTIWRIDGAEGERIASPVLATDGGDATALRVREADVTDDGATDIVVGKRLSDGVLSIDVVSGRGGKPGVVLHLDLENGKAVLSDGQLVVFRAMAADGESLDNPSKYQKWVIVPNGDGWALAENSLVDASAVGGSQL